MARWKGLEPPTFWFVAKHSIQLSYQRVSASQHKSAKAIQFGLPP